MRSQNGGVVCVFSIKTKFTITAALLLSLNGLQSAQAQAAQPAASPRELFVVQLRKPPVARYDGQIKGLATTRPTAGQKLDTNAPQVRAYLAHLDQERNRVLSSTLGPLRVAHRYNVVFNGFAASLTAEQRAGSKRMQQCCR
jgi:hypothetical protein